ncbi:MAG: septum formation initiator family protein [Deltaproteobacteria bacterium]|nr:septum formation initiator family protein [Deltaproteobacteria bacterium]
MMSLRRLLDLLTPARVAITIAVGFFVWFFLLGDQGVVNLRKLLAMKERLLNEQHTLERDIKDMTHQKELMSDPANLEMVIRKELGAIKPGEVIFELTPEKPAQNP